MPDSSTSCFPADFLLRGATTRDPSRQTARLADQFLERNRSRFRELDLEVEPRYDGARVELLVRAGIKVGAIPLLSPTTGRSDYGIRCTAEVCMDRNWRDSWCDRLADNTDASVVTTTSAFGEKNPALGLINNNHRPCGSSAKKFGAQVRTDRAGAQRAPRHGRLVCVCSTPDRSVAISQRAMPISRLA